MEELTAKGEAAIEHDPVEGTDEEPTGNPEDGLVDATDTDGDKEE